MGKDWCAMTKKHISRKERAFNNWYNKLLMITANIFKCENLPANLPLWQIESRLIRWGFCCVFKNEVYGIITSDCTLSGVDIYNMPNNFTYGQAVIGSSPKLMENLVDGVIGWGCSADKLYYNSRGVIGDIIAGYADLLSDIDITERISLINGRAISSVTAKSDNALMGLKEFYRQLENGELYIPKIESGVLDSTEDILKNATRTGSLGLAELDTCRQNILKLFYSEMGISYSSEKRERLITDEVAADEDALSSNITDWLNCRKEFAEKINNTYGTSLIYEVNNDVIT